jgi:transcriptional regulator with PAS, ATPase and Fis domain
LHQDLTLAKLELKRYSFGPHMLLHPIIDEYVNSEANPLAIVEKHHHTDQLLETTFILVLRSLGKPGVDFEVLKAIDEAIVIGHPDTNVYLLFIVSAMVYTTRKGQNDQSKSLYSIIASTMNKNVHPIIQALCMQAHAQIKRIECNFVETKNLMRQSMTLVDTMNSRYRLLLRNYSVGLAAEGLLRDLNESDLELLNSKTIESHAKDFLHIKLGNCVFIGEANEAHQLISEYKNLFPNNENQNIEDALTALKILHGDLNEDNHEDAKIKVLVRQINAIINGNYDKALELQQWVVKNTSSGENAIINYYFPLHLELALGNRGKVQLMLLEKTQNSGHHYLDDLFYGRLQLLSKDFEKADKTFQQLIKNVTHYGAMNRLIYELQFVKEMALPDILKLSQGWKNYGQHVTAKIISKEKKQKPLPSGVDLLVGHSAVIVETRVQVKKYAKVNAPILITGETGTGKELVARAIHEEGSFAKEPFLAINCGSLTDTLLQSELFGYVAGAFTGAQKERKGIFESAGKGTVFLDEFGDVSPKLQVSLLRVLESNEIRLLGATVNRNIECKIVVATNVNLRDAVESKKFRDDLYFRLTRFEIKLPPLHERAEDIPELIQHFLDNNQGTTSDEKSISKELLSLLSAYHWPGNIRELKNEIDRLYILNPDKKILEKIDFDFSRLAENHNVKVENTPLPKDEDLLQIMKGKGFVVENRHAYIKELFLKHKKLTRNQIMAVTKVSPSTATKDLQILCDAGFIIKKSPTKSPRTDYFELT